MIGTGFPWRRNIVEQNGRKIFFWNLAVERHALGLAHVQVLDCAQNQIIYLGMIGNNVDHFLESIDGRGEQDSIICIKHRAYGMVYL